MTYYNSHADSWFCRSSLVHWVWEASRTMSMSGKSMATYRLQKLLSLMRSLRPTVQSWMRCSLYWTSACSITGISDLGSRCSVWYVFPDATYINRRLTAEPSADSHLLCSLWHELPDRKVLYCIQIWPDLGHANAARHSAQLLLFYCWNTLLVLR